MDHPEGPPLALAILVSECGEAEQHVKSAPQRCNSAPSAVNRLALSASWLALEIAMDEVCRCAAFYPASRAAVSWTATACARFEALHFQLERSGLLHRPKDIDYTGR